MEASSRFAPKPSATNAAADIAAPLLAYVRGQAGEHVVYAAPPSRITGGFDTATWGFQLRGAPEPWDVPLIARVYRDGGVQQARNEAAAMRAVVRQGYPAPPIVHVCIDTTVLGNAFLVMPRAPGVPMLSKMIGPGIMRMSVLLGELHARLHMLDVDRFRHDTRDGGSDPEALWSQLTWTRNIIASAKLVGLRDAADWLENARPAPPSQLAVCHGDFHPLNILVDGDTATVIDWSFPRVADPAWDVGAAVALFGYAPVDLPGILMPLLNRMRGWVLRRYLRAYQSLRPLDLQRVRYYEAERLMGFVAEAGEHRQALLGVIPPTTKPTAFHAPRVVDAIARRIEKISGVSVQLPAAPA